MATVYAGSEIIKKILKLFGIEDACVLKVDIHMAVDDIVTIDMTRYATRADGELIRTEDEKEIVKELKKYRLEEIKDYTSPTEKLVIESDGNVGIGT